MDEKQLYKRIEQFAEKDTVIAFSGGVDSALLLKLVISAANRKGTKVYAVTIHNALQPMDDLELTRQLAKEFGAEHYIINADSLLKAGIENNPPDRCYRCKKYLFQQIISYAKEVGASYCLDGTNADDLTVYRPGLRAVKELGIISPLAECGMTKKEVRMLAEKLGISVAKRPSMPCLATRIPYGDLVTKELLAQIEMAEKKIRNLGYYNVRVRAYGKLARIEVDKKDLVRLVASSDLITAIGKEAGFDYITVDLEGFRSGSMDINVADKIEEL